MISRFSLILRKTLIVRFRDFNCLRCKWKRMSQLYENRAKWIKDERKEQPCRV